MTDLQQRIDAISRVPLTIEVSLVTYIRTLVWGGTRDGRSAEDMASAIVADRAGNVDNLRESASAANTHAAILGVPTADYIRELIRKQGIEIPGVDIESMADSTLMEIFGRPPSPGELDLSSFESSN